MFGVWYHIIENRNEAYHSHTSRTHVELLVQVYSVVS